MKFFSRKLYYKIREVGEIAGVKAHVLRFWETEFPALSPPKGRNGQRVYRPRDIELILEIRKLLYEDGYTIAGARRHLGMNMPVSAMKRSALPKETQPSVSAPKLADPSSGSASLPLFDTFYAEPPLPENAALPPPDTAGNHPASEQLKRVQTELENILTLLDRE
jgi:DNA-binding transcriptional MerR regulator